MIVSAGLPSLALLGIGWVTALGSGEEAWHRLHRGERTQPEPVGEKFARTFYKLTPPLESYQAYQRHPRLRRSSRISHLALSAAKAALDDAGVNAAALAIIFTVSSGGVLYTRRFFQAIAEHDASHASPLLFPETVYNAPGSHIAAVLGIEAPVYTLTGDAAVGFSGIDYAATLLATGEAEQVLIVAAEECDPVLCEAYHVWGLFQPGEDPRTALPGEGAAAIVVSLRESAMQITGGTTSEPAPLPMRTADWHFSGANGTAADQREAQFGVEAKHRNTPKFQLGETLGAAALIQTVAGAYALRDGLGTSAVATSCGWNQESGWARIVRN